MIRNPRKTKIGIIGLGQIGSRIAEKLLKSDKQVVAFDIDNKRLAQMSSKGVIQTRDPAGVASLCNIILLSLPDPDIVEEVVAGKDGILSTGRRGILIIDLSTNSPAKAIEIENNCRLSGNMFIDAPLTGGVQGIERGAVTVMMGGNRALVANAIPILNLFAERVVHVGPTGHGAATKLIHNMLGEIQVYAIAEAFAIAKKLGLDLEKVYSVLSNGMATSRILTELYAKGALRGEFKPRATVNMAAKDQRLLVDMTKNAGIDLTFTPIVLRMIRKLQHKGFGQSDVTSALFLFEEKYNVKVRVSDAALDM